MCIILSSTDFNIAENCTCVYYDDLHPEMERKFNFHKAYVGCIPRFLSTDYKWTDTLYNSDCLQRFTYMVDYLNHMPLISSNDIATILIKFVKNLISIRDDHDCFFNIKEPIELKKYIQHEDIVLDSFNVPRQLYNYHIPTFLSTNKMWTDTVKSIHYIGHMLDLMKKIRIPHGVFLQECIIYQLCNDITCNKLHNH